MKHSTTQSGFTLIELAVVMLILAFLLTSAFMSITALRKTANINEANQKMAEIEQALYGFAVANGRLPCPTIPGLGGVSNPADPTIAAAGQQHCANSPNIAGYIGFVPSTTLGIQGQVNCDGLLLDPWNRPYRYSISNVDAGNGRGDFVTTDDLTNANEGMANVTADLQVCRNLATTCLAGTAAANIIANNAVAVIFSMGEPRANSLRENENAGEAGAVIPSLCGAGNYPVSNDRFYYSAPIVERAGSEFDDLLIWISPNILFNKLLDANRLP